MGKDLHKKGLTQEFESPLALLLQRALNVLSLAAVRGEHPYVLAQMDPVLPEEEDPRRRSYTIVTRAAVRHAVRSSC
jgi:hypothetical protein